VQGGASYLWVNESIKGDGIIRGEVEVGEMPVMVVMLEALGRGDDARSCRPIRRDLVTIRRTDDSICLCLILEMERRYEVRKR
jgi:hypothetical protein